MMLVCWIRNYRKMGHTLNQKHATSTTKTLWILRPIDKDNRIVQIIEYLSTMEDSVTMDDLCDIFYVSRSTLFFLLHESVPVVSVVLVILKIFLFTIDINKSIMFFITLMCADKVDKWPRTISDQINFPTACLASEYLLLLVFFHRIHFHVML